MTIRNLHQILNALIDEGYGDVGVVVQGTDFASGQEFIQDVSEVYSMGGITFLIK